MGNASATVVYKHQALPRRKPSQWGTTQHVRTQQGAPTHLTQQTQMQAKDKQTRDAYENMVQHAAHITECWSVELNAIMYYDIPSHYKWVMNVSLYKYG